jgi:ribosome-associated toxin RatA of RatAB toxin-antitoxin module
VAVAVWSIHPGCSAAPPAEPTPGVRVDVRVKDGVYLVEGGFEVERPTAAVWAVLTDYEALPDLLSGMRQSRVLSRAGRRVLVHQEVQARALVFSRTLHVLLEVWETPPRQLDFRDTLHRDFELYEGVWRLRATAAGAQVQYRLRARPKRSSPRFLTESALEGQVQALLSELRQQVVRGDD